MATHLRAELVLDAMEIAVGQRRPGERSLLRNARSDRRQTAIPTCLPRVLRRPIEFTQYTSVAFGKRYGEAGVRRSMGSVGDAYDHAMAESFFSTLEAELLSRRRFTSQAEARMACFSYIEGWSDPVWLHSGWDTARQSPTKPRCKKCSQTRSPQAHKPSTETGQPHSR